MTFSALKEAQGKLDAKRKEVSDIFSEAGPEIDLTKVKGIAGVNDAVGVAAHIRRLNDEMEPLQKQVDDLLAVQKAAQRNAEDGSRESGSENGEPMNRQLKSVGEQFIQNNAYKHLFTDQPTYGVKGTRNGNPSGPDSGWLDTDLKSYLNGVGLKTTMTTSAGWAPQAVRTDVVIPNALRPIQVTDLIPQTETTQSAVVFMEETTATNSAVETAENAAYQESAFAYTQRTSNVKKIAHFLPVSDEQLEDIPQIRSILDERMPFFVQQRLDLQIVAGDGTGSNLTGLLNTAGISTQAKAADTTPDAMLKAIVKVRVTGRATPTGVLMHSTDWQNLLLIKDTTGNYLWGSPTQGGPQQIWGLPISVTETTTAGTAVVADFRGYTALYVRRGLNVQVSNSHASFFINGLQAIRADMRAAFVVYRPAAVCTVTGL